MESKSTSGTDASRKSVLGIVKRDTSSSAAAAALRYSANSAPGAEPTATGQSLGIDPQATTCAAAILHIGRGHTLSRQRAIDSQRARDIQNHRTAAVATGDPIVIAGAAAATPLAWRHNRIITGAAGFLPVGVSAYSAMTTAGTPAAAVVAARTGALLGGKTQSVYVNAATGINAQIAVHSNRQIGHSGGTGKEAVGLDGYPAIG